MHFRALLLATAIAGSSLFLAACGGDVQPSQFGSASEGNQSQLANAGGSGSTSGNTGASSGTIRVSCDGPNNGTSSASSTTAQYVAIDLHCSVLASSVGYAIGGGEQVGVAFNLLERALLWRGSASTLVDLQPDGFTDSRAVATSGGVQVGSGSVDYGYSRHALKWAGTASSVVDLDPTARWPESWSEALGISGDQIVGYRWTRDGSYRAVVWTNNGVISLHPSGFSYSSAQATDGTQQVGVGWKIDATGYNHALLWVGSADSVVDLHPSGYYSSNASGVGDGQQVGYADSRGSRRALLWSGSASSVVNLHVPGFLETVAVAVASGRQVGWGAIAYEGPRRALLWKGTAESVVDLHSFLPPGTYSSQASGIDASGNVVGTADGRAVLWVRQ
jgi:hypothetical protein